jgi:hypothetical protein
MLQSIPTTSTEYGSGIFNDQMTINGPLASVFVMGGVDDDIVSVTDSLFNILLGDYGQLNVGYGDIASGGGLVNLYSVSTADEQVNNGGGNDQLSSLTISSNEHLLSIAATTNIMANINDIDKVTLLLSSVRSIIMGGSLDDIITSNGRCSVQCGDQCSLQPYNSVSSENTYIASVRSGNDQMNFIGNHQVGSIS